ncbi:AbrB family transcriptional regulator [Salicibibacter cibarius]|uniref:AbrB family transcriptional regulator n=1 Tax=Salicibibacter cibarius TaxID=2743000 RepID=A0A7T7CCY7_9BACI|nr:AbrB/MazE/SpoVT family DNA-binding domain-containing protein [Salicibibacter cibarius]QQK77419.1 AbrB family transcriptional regulator [Salicibibacter cibarius]
MERKITNVGRLNGITLPEEVLKHLKAGRGDSVKFTLNDDGTVSIVKKADHNLDFMDDTFIEGLNKAFDQYDEGYKKLVDR